MTTEQANQLKYIYDNISEVAGSIADRLTGNWMQISSFPFTATEDCVVVVSAGGGGYSSGTWYGSASVTVTGGITLYHSGNWSSGTGKAAGSGGSTVFAAAILSTGNKITGAASATNGGGKVTGCYKLLSQT